MTRARAAGWGCTAAVALAACGPGAPPEVRVAGADTLVREESGLLAAPADLAVDAAGRVFVTDQILGEVLVLGNGEPRVLGAPGAGPGEFQAPEALAVARDTLWVEDRGNGRLQVLTAAGAYVRSHRLPSTAGRTVIDGRGRMAAATLGLSGGWLALMVDGGGHLRHSFGKLAAPPARGWDMVQMKREAARGRVPATLRNAAQPVLDGDGGAWLLMQADGEVRRYDARGELLWSRPLRTPETRRIREAFFATNRKDERPFSFFPLSHVSDAAAVGGELWVLLNLPDDESSVVLVVSADGGVARRMVLVDVQGARSLAVDPARRTLYLAVPSRASIVRIVLPTP